MDKVFKDFDNKFLSLIETLLPDRFLLLGKLERRASENYFIMGDTDTPESIYCNTNGEFFNPPKGKFTAILTDKKQDIPESKAGRMALLASHTPSFPFYVLPLLEEFVKHVPFQTR